jgi:hypothetical protein
MIYYILLLLLFTINFIFNYKKGFSFPLNYTMIFVFSYFIVKYFIYYYTDIPPLSNIALSSFDKPGILLLWFFSLAFITQAVFSLYGRQHSKIFKYYLEHIYFKERINVKIIIYLLLALITIIAIGRGGFEVLYSPLTFRRLITSQGFYYILFISMFFSSYYSLKLLFSRKLIDLLIFSIIYGLFAFISGMASLQIYYFLNLILLRSMCFRKSIKIYIVIILLLLIPYAVFTGIHRTISHERPVTLDQFMDVISTGNELKGSFEFFLTNILYRIDHLERVAELCDAIDSGEMEIAYGSDAASIFLQWIPRSLYPEKPLNFTRSMTLYFNPDVYYQDAGNCFTGIGEMYYNFGYLGVLVSGILFGIILYYACLIWQMTEKSLYLSFLLIVILYPFLTLSVLAGFINDLALPNLIIYVVLFFVTIRISDVRLTD